MATGFFKSQKLRKAKPARPIKQEDDEGNIEYKFKINDWMSHDRRESLKTQMLYRIHQGEGWAVYNLGYHDDGRPVGLPYILLLETLKVLFEMAEDMEADVKSVKILKGWRGHCANVYLEKEVNTDLLPPGVEDFHDD